MPKKTNLEGVRKIKHPRMDPKTMIRLRTELLRWTQERLAQEMGVTDTLVQMWENGRSPIPFSRAKHMKTLLRLITLERRIVKNEEVEHDKAVKDTPDAA